MDQKVYQKILLRKSVKGSITETFFLRDLSFLSHSLSSYQSMALKYFFLIEYELIHFYFFFTRSSRS